MVQTRTEFSTNEGSVGQQKVKKTFTLATLLSPLDAVPLTLTLGFFMVQVIKMVEIGAGHLKVEQ